MVDASDIGRRVKTRAGKGKIHKLLGNGYIVTMTDDSNPALNGLKLQMSAKDVVFENEPETIQNEEATEINIYKKSSPPITAPKKKTTKIDLLKTIEALRFGLVPKEGLENMTLGYPELAEWIRNRLPSQGDAECKISEICGPFGTGKSHTMAAVRQFALKHNYVIAQVEVDGKNVSLSRPKSLLAQIYSSLQAAELNPISPALDLHLKAIGQGKDSNSIGKDSEFKRARTNYWLIHRLYDANAIDYLEDELESTLSCSGEYTVAQVIGKANPYLNLDPWDIRLNPPIGRRVINRPYDFVFSLVSMSRIAKMAGYRGLVLTIDEFEVEYNLAPKMRERIESVIDALSAYLEDRNSYPKAYLSIFFATIGEDECEGDMYINALIEAGCGDVYDLVPWDADLRVELACKIHDFYCRAYDYQYSFNPQTVESVEKSLINTGEGDSGMIRAFIKRYVARLDREYGPPANGV